MSQATPLPELSRPIAVDRIGAQRIATTIEASEPEMAALAERFDLQAIHALVAQVACRRVRGGHYVEVECELEARLTQTCVMTLEPVQEDVHDRQILLFGPLDHRPGSRPSDLTLAYDAEEPEPIEDGLIDLGEVVAQQLALAIDPYPKTPGAEIPPGDD